MESRKILLWDGRNGVDEWIFTSVNEKGELNEDDRRIATDEEAIDYMLKLNI